MRLEEAYGARGEGLKARLARSLGPDGEGLTQGYESLCLSVHISAYSLHVRGREGWQEDNHVQGQKT